MMVSQMYALIDDIFADLSACELQDLMVLYYKTNLVVNERTV